MLRTFLRHDARWNSWSSTRDEVEQRSRRARGHSSQSEEYRLSRCNLPLRLTGCVFDGRVIVNVGSDELAIQAASASLLGELSLALLRNSAAPFVEWTDQTYYQRSRGSFRKSKERLITDLAPHKCVFSEKRQGYYLGLLLKDLSIEESFFRLTADRVSPVLLARLREAYDAFLAK